MKTLPETFDYKRCKKLQEGINQIIKPHANSVSEYNNIITVNIHFIHTAPITNKQINEMKLFLKMDSYTIESFYNNFLNVCSLKIEFFNDKEVLL